MPEENNLKTPICITGGTGFLGKHLLKLLKKETHLKIKVLTRSSADADLPKNVEPVTGDMMDPHSLNRFLEPGATVINMAYLKNASPDKNIHALKNLANSCKEASVAMFLHVSSAVVAGRTDEEIVTEATVCNPITEYEKTKLQMERILLNQLKDKCPISIVRPTAVFGEGGKNLTKHIDKLIKESIFMKRSRLSIYGRRKMNLVHVNNVTSAIWFLACNKKDINRQYYIISDDEFKENNYADVVEIITEELKLSPLYAFNIPHKHLILSVLLLLKGRSNTNARRIYSPNKLLKSGFRKPVIFSEGLRQFIKNYIQAKHILNT